MMENPYESLTFGNSLSLRVDGAIGTMSLSPNGRDAVLAGRKGLFIIDLDDPFKAPRWLHHITSWEVADVQWSPHHALKPSWCISTSNQKALLWDLARPSSNAIAHVLHRHTRAITDINFHLSDPEILATCSIDTFVYSWDMRSPRRPVGKWAEWRAGATQVKWSQSNPYQLASSHDHSFFVWDTRNGALPILKVESAHKGKINGLDYSNADDKLTTCSNDESVKIWDISRPNNTTIRPSVVMKANFPIARARSLPFGKDSCCGIMPLREGGNAVHIVNYQGALERHASTGETVNLDVVADYSFRGHQGPIKDFLWRTLRSNYLGFENKHPWEKYQLVSWSSQDYDLKLWPHDDQIYEIANYNPQHQKLFSSLLRSAGGSDSEEHGAMSRADSPDIELDEEPLSKRSNFYGYNTYCTEPALGMKEYSRVHNGDLLSSTAYFQILHSRDNLRGSNQLNHLDWISGVRMGNPGAGRQGAHAPTGPSNLGEEVSIVGHKFPKLRFEKISVSTGHLVMTLKGPLPKVEKNEGNENLETPEEGSATDENRTNVTIPKTRPSVQNSNSSNTQQQLSYQTTSSSQVLRPGISDGPLPPPNTVANNDVISASKQIQSESSDAPSDTKGDNEQNLAFIRLEIRFPLNYPALEDTNPKSGKSKSLSKYKNNRIRFDIEETHEITSKIKTIMINGLNEIANFYSNKFSRFCLEPCLRYLMGDKITLDETDMIREANEIKEAILDNNSELIEVGSEGWADDLVNQHIAASTPSSDFALDDEEDEDADIIPTIDDRILTDNRASDDGADVTMLEYSSEMTNERVKHDTTPLPKGCGAVWSTHGHLVCFFMRKENEDGYKRQPEFNKVHTDNDASSERLIIRNESIPVDSFARDLSCEVSSESLLNDETSLQTSLSSDESFNNDWDDLLENDIPSRTRIKGIFKGSMRVGGRIDPLSEQRSDTNFTHSAGGTVSNYKSSTFGDHSTKGRKEKSIVRNFRNIVTILDFSELISDKYELAASYKVMGDSAEKLAKHNSDVAQYYGFSEISDVWKLLAMILMSKTSTEDSYAENLHTHIDSLNGTFCWGNHPYGNNWLIRKIFEYFEHHNNLQMLAMMSCVLHERSTEKDEESDDCPRIPIKMKSASSTQLLLKSGLSNSQYQPLEDNFSSSFQELLKKPTKNKAEVGSFRDEYSDLFDQIGDKSVPRHLLRNASEKRKISNTQTASATSDCTLIPDQNIYKRGKFPDSPYRFAVRNQGASIKSFTNRRGPLLLCGNHSKERLRPPPSVSIVMHNAECLDIFSDRFTSPLLSTMDDNVLHHYRESYADMLHGWSLLYNRAEVLKFNHFSKMQVPEKSTFEEFYCAFGLRFRKAYSLSQLLLSPLTPVRSARNNAWNTKKRNLLQTCSLCAMLVNKRAIVCPNCEHILHSACALIWWSGEQLNDMECPTGCGCRCLHHNL